MRKGTKRPKPNWLQLPEHLTAKIFSKVGVIDVLNNVQRVCTVWKRITKEPTVWRYIDMNNTGELFDMDFDIVKLCRHAVDRSEGRCVSINIEHFATDDLLKYIADRCKCLKQLRMIICYDIQDEGLSEVAKLPLLEELELSICKNVSGDAWELVGESCPLLKSLKLNSVVYISPFGDGLPYTVDKEALAIAKTMHGLHHLQLVGNKLTNVGLEAILDGCPYLESLDLRRCYNINLEGELGKRCAKQIKNLRYPNDSVDDYDFETGDPKDSRDCSDCSDYCPGSNAYLGPVTNPFHVSSEEDDSEEDYSSGTFDSELESDEDDVSDEEDEDDCDESSCTDND